MNKWKDPFALCRADVFFLGVSRSVLAKRCVGIKPDFKKETKMENPSVRSHVCHWIAIRFSLTKKFPSF